MHSILILLLICFSFIFQAYSQTVQECSALNDLWYSTNGVWWTNPWSGPPNASCESICGFSGVTCGSGHITKL